MKNILFSILLIAASSLYAQRLLKMPVQFSGEEKKEISYLIRNGLEYISANEISDLFNVSKFYNEETAKLEIKFEKIAIKVTAKSQFIVLVDKETKEQSVYQIPISTLLIKDQVFVPLTYFVEYLSGALGKQVDFDPIAKNIMVTNKALQSTDDTAVAVNDNKDSVASDIKYDIYDIKIEEKVNGTLIRLKANKTITVPRHSINNNILFVFLPNVIVNPQVAQNVKAAGLVKTFKRTQVSYKNTQLEFSLDEGYSTSEAFTENGTNDIIISIRNKVQANKPIPDSKEKWKFDCVVIDAGHGGKDPGTIGVTGVKEKDVNLAVALKLGNLISSNLPEVKVVYTRKTDEFIELYKRGKIANDAGGKLFISIHCNSTESKDNGYRGFEVYLLRPGRTKEAIRIAEFENSVIKFEENQSRYDKLTEENFILVSMVHSQYMRFSEKFSDLLNEEWKKNVPIPSLGIKQAGFYVLVGASMPGVLIENGFMSNRKDEAYLASKSGQSQIAETIFNSIYKYKEEYEKEIEQ